ncbi:hypothetical protein [Pedobacter gandavensis]|uniref:WxL domain-containing protein n=1 Tax=Pedobacter gandavensis TaxID=2679963 RepID=A0ABR6EX67_9SPHI|nr:hypothetical protein [Pedobacter gandavensis]MBB2149873.1 hypothetical protein [Pedobacter gandavensis]
MKKILLALTVICAGAVSATAQVATGTTTTRTQNMKIIIKEVFDLALTPGTLQTFSFDALSNYDAAGGIELAAVNTMNYKSNHLWKVTAIANAPEFVFASTANSKVADASPMPTSVLQIRKTGGTYQALPASTGAAITVASGSRGSGNFTLDYKAVPGYTYQTGEYTIGVVYTMTNQ